MAKNLTQEQLIEEAKKNLNGYTDKEIEAFVLGAKFAGMHTVKHHDAEWYRKRDEERAKPNGFVEYMMTESPLARAVENLKHMKTYEEIETEVLEKLIRALDENDDLREMFIAMALKSAELTKKINKLKSKEDGVK